MQEQKEGVWGDWGIRTRTGEVIRGGRRGAGVRAGEDEGRRVSRLRNTKWNGKIHEVKMEVLVVHFWYNLLWRIGTGSRDERTEGRNIRNLRNMNRKGEIHEVEIEEPFLVDFCCKLLSIDVMDLFYNRVTCLTDPFLTRRFTVSLLLPLLFPSSQLGDMKVGEDG